MNDFPLSYESDGKMGKGEREETASITNEENKEFFNTTPASE